MNDAIVETELCYRMKKLLKQLDPQSYNELISGKKPPFKIRILFEALALFFHLPFSCIEQAEIEI